MKKIIYSLLVLLCMAGASCKKDHPAVIAASAVNATLSSGTWRITSFSDNGQDKTANFTGYVFTFAGSSVLTAVKASTTVSGSWSTDTDDSKVKLTLFFPTPANFAELSEDWQVVQQSSTLISLQDDGNSAETLTFQKN